MLLVVHAMVSAPPSGTDAVSGIQYSFVSVEGKLIGVPDPATPPRLTAQCTKDTKGKQRFELLADAGGVGELRYVPPFKPSGSRLYAPDLPKAIVVMEFLGYRKEKPVKRQWTGIDGLPDEWKYATPGLWSANMEDVTLYLQYLRALPTLRLTLPGGSGQKPIVVEFETADWQKRVKAEPMCAASGL